jgi:hypothetical protein
MLFLLPPVWFYGGDSSLRRHPVCGRRACNIERAGGNFENIPREHPLSRSRLLVRSSPLSYGLIGLQVSSSRVTRDAEGY